MQRKTTRTDLDSGECVFAIVGEGEALEPKFTEGTIFIFDPDREPRNKDYVLLLQEGKTLPQFRQIFVDGADFYAKAINPLLLGNNLVPLSPNTKILGSLIQAKSNFIA